MFSLTLFAVTALVAQGDPPVDFSREVRPILSRRCFVCHGPDEGTREARLRLDLRDAAVQERDGWAPIVPGDTDASEIIARITDADDPMPPAAHGHPLTDAEVDVVRRWIEQGAEYTQHWAFVPPVRPAIPQPGDGEWAGGAIDAFIRQRLESAGMESAPRADRATLARRVSLDLIGLPPTLEQVRGFQADDQPLAYANYVDALLADPGYGERWASVWLDLARYADSKGHGSDPLRQIWRYRDWVIDALNANMPFDEFTRQQLAGDLMPDATMETRLATAFHRNTMTNTEGGTDNEEYRVAAVKDRAITTAQVWLGMTLGCAQCHSHKYDPVSHKEFYEFYAIFNQTVDADNDDDAPLLDTPRPDDRVILDERLAEIELLKAHLSEQSSGVQALMAEWERGLDARKLAWTVPHALSLASSGGATLTELEDGSILASGASPDTDVTTIDFASLPGQVTGIQLEVLPHESLAQGGPGREGGIGNAILNDFRMLLLPLAGELRASTLRISLPGEQRILSLAEVEILVGGENVALDGTASQSSTGFGGLAVRAIDGNTDGDYHRTSSVTHTNTETDPWWQVDLGETLTIEGLRVWNRTDGNLEERMRGFVVEALDDTGKVVWRTELRGVPDPSMDIAVDEQEVAFHGATADFSDPDWGIERAIDEDRGRMTGWGLNPSLGGSHLAVFELAHPLQDPHRVRFELVQDFGGRHTLGRIRLSSTGDASVLEAIPYEAEAALAVPSGERSQAQSDAVLLFYQRVDPHLQGLRREIDEKEAAVVALAIPRTPVMVELPPDMRRTTHVLQRGSFLAPGEVVHASVPAVLPVFEGAELNRLTLADWLVRDDHPLTARVHVNRLWARLFGRGLVETEEDFGTQGAWPSHPDLLDWLAREFIESGWNTKALLRTMVMSETYMQSSDVSAQHLEVDPRNELYARGPRFRMEAEMVRDTILATSGMLSRKMHGPSIFPPQPDGLWQAAFNNQRTWMVSEGEDRNRRGLYVFLRRTVPYPSLATFDSTSRESCTLRRPRTNTPLQAFVTLNDPAYVDAARAFARRILAEGGATTSERAAFGLAQCLLRTPESARVEVVASLYQDALDTYEIHEHEASAMTLAGAPLPAGIRAAEVAAWTVVANVLLNQDALLVKD
jgi:hypothetical protein